MKIKLSSVAEQQLEEGYRFYQRQSKGIGDYFLDSLMADIKYPCTSMPVSTPFTLANITAFWLNASPARFTTEWKPTWF